MKTKTPFTTPLLLAAFTYLALAFPSPFAKAQTPQPASAPGRTIIVLDASGSMWGEVSGGGVKIDIAKKAVSELVESLDPAIELGLMAYGHRKKGDCEDIELLVAPAANTKDAVVKAVQSLVPRGKTPLSDAVLQAAGYLKFEESKATVILVSDGIETCDRDPCAIGDQLAAQGIDFVCHVIGFALKDAEKPGLKCLAEKTGGLYLDAKDADSLRSSLTRVVQTVVDVKSHLILAARNATGDLLDGVRFEIYGAKESEKPLHAGTGGKFRQEVEPGAYTVTAKFGDATADGTVEVPSGKTVTHEMKFEASGLVARALLTDDGEPIESGLGWRLYDKPADADRRPAVAYSYDAEPSFLVPPGTYYLFVKKGDSTAEKTVVVEAGAPTEVTIVFGSGILVATASMTEGGEPLAKGLGWNLLSAPDAEGDRKRVAYSYDPKTKIVAPAGKYLLKVKYKQSATQKEVELKAGETTEVALAFGAGTLVATAVMMEGGDPIEKDTKWDLLGAPNEEGDRKSAAYSYDAQPEFKVASGDYLLKLKRGQATTEQEVTIAAGEKTEVTLTLNAGIWTGTAFMAESSAEPVEKDLKWDVYGPPDSEGNRKQAAYSYDKQPRIVLPAGDYRVKVSRKAASNEIGTQVAPGKITEDKLVLNAAVVVFKVPAGVSKQAWQVYTVNAEGDRKSIAYSYDPEFKTALPAGTFIAEMEDRTEKERKKYEKEITVEPGKFLEVTVDKK